MVCETWIEEDTPDTVKAGLAPERYLVEHFHHPMVKGKPIRGCGLTFITCSDIIIRPHKLQLDFSSTSFEVHMLNILFGHREVMVVFISIYRSFIDDFGKLLLSLNFLSSDRLLICDEFKLPECNSGSINDDLIDILSEFGMMKHVSSCTHHDIGHALRNILNLVISADLTDLLTACRKFTFSV